MSAPRRPQVLYLTSSKRSTAKASLSRETRIVVGVLARDADLSLAIAGPVDHQALQKLRDHFASVRVAGGFPASSADQPAAKGLRALSKSQLGSDIVNARLQAAIVLVNQKANADDIAARLARLFDEGNALRPIARDILALAYFTKDAPLKARELYAEQLADPDATPFSKQRAQIMLSEVEAKLRPSAQAE